MKHRLTNANNVSPPPPTFQGPESTVANPSYAALRSMLQTRERLVLFSKLTSSGKPRVVPLRKSAFYLPAWPTFDVTTPTMEISTMKDVENDLPNKIV